MEREREERKQQKREDNDVLFIKETAVEKLLNWNDCVDAMESALVCMLKTNESTDEPFSSQTPRTFTPVSDKGVLLTMPGFASNYTLKAVTGNDCRHSTLACKLVTSFGGNSQLKFPVPTILATVLLLDATTGKLKAIIDGTDITTWRTAAVSVVATKYLYYNINQPTMSDDGTKITLSILGCGTQGRIHALAMLNYFPNFFNRVKLWNRTKQRAEKLNQELKELFSEVEFIVVDASNHCASDADCIVTATNASQPLFAISDLKENVHVNAIGAGVNHHSELPMELYASANVLIESNVGLETELKGLQEHVNGEIGEFIIGRKRWSGTGRTVFQSMGNAIEDAIMGNLIYQKLIKL